MFDVEGQQYARDSRNLNQTVFFSTNFDSLHFFTKPRAGSGVSEGTRRASIQSKKNSWALRSSSSSRSGASIGPSFLTSAVPSATGNWPRWAKPSATENWSRSANFLRVPRTYHPGSPCSLFFATLASSSSQAIKSRSLVESRLRSLYSTALWS